MADLSVGKFKRHSIAVLRISYIERPKVKRGNKPKVLICTAAAVVSKPKNNTDESQLWLIAGLDATLETVIMYNKVNSVVLAAIT
ncbi:MAG: hypothetical protein LQ341_004730, partial [Variospora aurantia]